MIRALLAAMLLGVPMAAIAADDLKVQQLEQDVRDLQRQVQAQSRQIEELRAQLARPAAQPSVPASPAAVATDTGAWINASRWEQVRVGMDELEVVSLLGPPSTLRTTDGSRVLLYAREIGSSGFLGGSVTLRDRKVTEVRKPVLR
jgi:outer membrane murein-binding lipoprotein Lpp